MIPKNGAPPTGEVEGGAKKLNELTSERTRIFAPKQDRVAAIKDALTLRQIIAECGIVVPERDDVKFSSPFRFDRSPSCTVHGERLMDWSQGRSWDALDFYAEVHGISLEKTIAILYARICRAQAEESRLPRCFRRAASENHDPGQSAKQDADDRARRRETWVPHLRAFKGHEIDCIKLLRNVSAEAVERAILQGNLSMLDSVYGPAWVLSNHEKTNGQARLIDGKPWRDSNNAKSKTLAGSFAAQPIIGDLKPHQAIALVEGGPDFLSVHHHALASGVEDAVCPVAMLGAGLRIPDYHLTLLAGRRLRIFVHNDHSGRSAAARWAQQLQGVGCIVDGFDFSGLVQDDGRPVGDLNDLCRLGVDSWEDNRDVVESAFSFAMEVA